MKFKQSQGSRLGAIGIVPLAAVIALAFASSAQAATAIGLGTADSYAILGGSGVTNTGPSVINGDLGTAPTPSVSGFGGAPNGTVNGAIHQADAAAANAKDDLTTAYNNAAGQGPVNTVATELGGQTLTPGVYDSVAGDFGITGALTLNAQGDPNAVFIFQTASTLISASASQVLMVNGAQSCNVFWKVGSSATLGTSSTFAGNILADQSISLNDAVTVDGRLLARIGAVTLINDTVTRAQCAALPPTPTPTPTPVPTPTPTPTPPGGGNPPGGGGPGPGGGGPGPGGGGPGGGSPPGGPDVHITPPPHGHTDTPESPRCISHGFSAHIKVHSKLRMRSVSVFVDNKLIMRTTRKEFDVWVKSTGLDSERRNTIRVVAVDRKGRRDVSTAKFRRCAAAVPSPQFTG